MATAGVLPKNISVYSQEKFFNLICKNLGEGSWKINRFIGWGGLQELIDGSLEPLTHEHYMATQANWWKESACLNPGKSYVEILLAWNNSEEQLKHEVEYWCKYSDRLDEKELTKEQRAFSSNFEKKYFKHLENLAKRLIEGDIDEGIFRKLSYYGLNSSHASAA